MGTLAVFLEEPLAFQNLIVVNPYQTVKLCIISPMRVEPDKVERCSCNREATYFDIRVVGDEPEESIIVIMRQFICIALFSLES